MSVDILGVRVDDVTYAEAVRTLRQAIERRVPHVVTTPNPEFVMLARRDEARDLVSNLAIKALVLDGVNRHDRILSSQSYQADGHFRRPFCSPTTSK